MNSKLNVDPRLRAMLVERLRLPQKPTEAGQPDLTEDPEFGNYVSRLRRIAESERLSATSVQVLDEVYLSMRLLTMALTRFDDQRQHFLDAEAEAIGHTREYVRGMLGMVDDDVLRDILETCKANLPNNGEVGISMTAVESTE